MGLKITHSLLSRSQTAIVNDDVRKEHSERLRGREQSISRHNGMCCVHSEVLGAVERGKNEPNGVCAQCTRGSKPPHP